MYITPDIVKQLQSGNEEAFNTMYESYKKLLYFIIVSIIKDEMASQDILQDTFVKIYNRATDLENPNKFHSWACNIAKNLALNYIRDNRKYTELSDNLLSVYEAENSTFTYFNDMNSYLTDLENTIVFYKIQYDFTLQEIVKFTKIPLSTVYKIYKEALKKIKEHYSEE